jgi:hypothetical protein
MNESYDLKGRVQRVEQRRPGISRLEHLRDLESFDIEFSPIGQVIQTIHYTHARSVAGSERFLYDEAGTLISSISFNGAGLQMNITEYEYDDDGRSLGWVIRDASGVATQRRVERYVGGFLASLVVFQVNGLAVREKSFQYAGKNLVKSVSKYYSRSGDLGEEWISHYDPNGRLEETFGLTAEGKPLGDGRYRFEYDTEGRTIKTWSFDDCTDDSVPNSVTFFEYTSDEVGNWTERRKNHRFRSDSEWTKQVTTRKISYYPGPLLS